MALNSAQASKSRLHLLPDDVYMTVDNGITIAAALQLAGISLTYPCGGKGVCGRCSVLADGESVLACTTRIERDMVIDIPDAVRLAGQKVLTNIKLYKPEHNSLPLIEKLFLQLSAPTLDDPLNDAARLKEAISRKMEIPVEAVRIEPGCMTELPHLLRDRNFELCVNLIHEDGGVSVISLSPEPLYGVAVDIGTTTVAMALCDLSTGFVIDTVGLANPQAGFGSDVISRIIYTEENPSGTSVLQQLIITTLNDAVLNLVNRANISPDDVCVMTVAANTTMSHFLLGLPTDFLRREPYIPVTNDYPVLKAAELGINIMSWGRVIVIPSISSYVGGDITAGVIATNINTMDGVNMLVDVGTNGEMVLAVEGGMIACSCSAGPSFEGSGISCGSRAIRGAIDNVYYHNNHLVYDIIGGHSLEPSSICGSGLISLLSALLQEGTIDRSGRFTANEKVYSIAPRVSITEPDIQNLIRSKGAIYAGMRVLTRHLDMQLADLNSVLIAGGFGRSLNVGDATNIGMFPALPKSSFDYVGNSALAGALRVMNDRTINASELAASILNLELSVGNEFMEEFTKACFLPHTDAFF